VPGTPATSPRFGAPRYANTDTSDFAAQVNAVVDAFDALGARIESGTLAARPSTGAGIANRIYRATDTGQVFFDAGGASPTWVDITPKAHASTHQDGGTDVLTVREAMMATGALGMAKGSFSAYRGTAATIASGAVVPFNTEERDISNWFDITTNVGRFTPQVAGYYSFAWSVQAAAAQAADVGWSAHLYKNGALHKQGQIGYQRVGGAGMAVNSSGFAEAQANGTTDFFEIVLLMTTGGTGALFANAATTYFQGHLIGRS
jgi:hypothetical protein